MSFSLDDPPNSRLFVVAGRNTSAEFLRTVFEQYGGVAFVKYLRDKGVAYVKYDRASSAALAIENLHEITLNDGLGPRLKVMLAESPHTRSLPGLHVRRTEDESPLDPDNTPPRSRLFMVVPKNADGSVIEAEMSRFAGMQYCKTDLVASKGIVFVKYASSSSACMAMEMVQQAGAVAGYKVKIMLAEPKTRRADSGGFLPGLGIARGGSGGMGQQQQQLLPGMGMPGGFGSGAPSSQLLSSLAPGLVGHNGFQDFASLQSAAASLGGGFAGGMPGGGTLRSAGSLDAAGLAQQQSGSLGGGGGSFQGLSGLGGGGSGGEYDYMNLGAFGGLGLASPMLGGAGLLGTLGGGQGGGGAAAQGLTNTRLFVVVHKSAGEEMLAQLFRCYPGMEYLDLKRDRATGRSKGYAYVNYTSPEAAAAAAAQLNGVEYPPGLGCRMKVMFAEPLGGGGAGGGAGGMPNVPSMGSMGSIGRPRSDEDLVAGDGPAAAAAAAAAAAGALMGTPSQDAAASAFHLSPASGDSIGPAGGYGAGAGAAQSLGQQYQQQYQQQLDQHQHHQQQQQQHSARTDQSSSSHDTSTHLSAQSSPLRLAAGGGGGGDLGAGSLLDPGAVDLAAVQHTLASMRLSLPGANGRLASPLSTGRVSSGLSDGGGGAGSWREPSPDHVTAASSAAASPAKLSARGDSTVVYSALPRPLPDYALTHVFAQCGPVEYVRVLPDERVALVKYATADAAALAVGSLNGVEVLGEVLQVRHSPPLTVRAPGPLEALGAP